MSDAADSAQDNAAPGTNAEGADGTGSNGKQPGDQEMVPRARLDAVLERDRRLETEIAELRGTVEGMKTQGSSGGEKTYTLAELSEMVDDEKISQAEADRIYTTQQEQRIDQIVTSRVDAALSDHSKRTTASTQIDKYAEALPDVLVEGSDTRAKYATEINYLGSLGHDTKKEETILLAMRAAFGPIERLSINPGKGKRDTVQDTNNAGEGGDEGDGGSASGQRWPKWMDQTQKDHYQKQIDNGYYKDRADCIERITKTSEHALKRGAARRAAVA